MAEKASRRSAKNLIKWGGVSRLWEFVEDATQEVSMEFFELSDFEKPQTENEFERWAFLRAGVLIRRYHAASKHETCDEVTNSEGKRFYKSEVYSQALQWYARTKPDQIIHMECLDAIKKIETLGDADRRLVYSVIKAGDIVGYSEDNDVSLFEAMDDLKRCRVIMNRIAEDLADEKKFGTPP